MRHASCLARLALSLVLLAPACATLPSASSTTAVPAPPQIPEVTWEQKLAWIIRLEDQRILRDPNPPPPAILAPATIRTPAVVAPAPPTDLMLLLDDAEARVRRRAALAIGRVGLPAGVEPLARLLSDAEPEVRQMAAFAIGLIGDATGRGALLQALADPDPIVHGRAAEALGMIGDRNDAPAVSTMVQAHVKAGVLASIEPDDLSYPLSPAVEAARLGLYALVRLGSYEALAAAALDGGGQPVSRWWPVAYALQRINDPRAAPALTTLAGTPGRYTASFAVRGLAAAKAAQALPMLRQIVEQRRAPAAVVLQAVRALATLRDTAAVPLLTKVVLEEGGDVTLRVESMTAFATLAAAESVDLLLDLVTDASPPIRAAALRTLARLDPDAFMSTIAGLDVDRDWTVRSAIATALGAVPPDQSMPRLMELLADKDQRVVAVAVAALAATRPAEVNRLLIERLKADDFAVRAAAANALAELKVAAAAPVLAAAYRDAAGDSAYAARAAAMIALNRINQEAALPILQEALQDRDWAVRVRAAQLLRERGASAETDTYIRPAVPGASVDTPEWRAIAAPAFSPHAFIETDKGTIEIELAVLDAPLTVSNFVTLARKGFFNGVVIHRVVPDFVVQDGDPRGDGEGGPGYTIRDELNERPYLRGTVGMALDWEDTGGSQFFITHSPAPHLDARYTVFGHVVNGMEVVDRIVQGDSVKQVRIWDGVTPQ